MNAVCVLTPPHQKQEVNIPAESRHMASCAENRICMQLIEQVLHVKLSCWLLWSQCSEQRPRLHPHQPVLWRAKGEQDQVSKWRSAINHLEEFNVK